MPKRGSRKQTAIISILAGLWLYGCGATAPLSSHDPTRTHREAPRVRTPSSPQTAPRRRPQAQAPLRVRGTTAARCRSLLPAAREVAEKHELDVGVLVAIARVESRFRPDARNRRSNATGLMQLMPSTAEYFECGDLSDPVENLDCGARVLRRYIDYFDGELTYGIAAYHTGPVAAKRARKKKRLPKNFKYVRKVMQWRSRFLRKGCF